MAKLLFEMLAALLITLVFLVVTLQGAKLEAAFLASLFGPPEKLPPNRIDDSPATKNSG